MRKNKWLVMVILLVGLAACSPALVEPDSSDAASAGIETGDAVSSVETEITGQVEAVNGNIWTVDGRTVVIETQTQGETAVAVGDTVSIQAVARNGGVFAASRVQFSQAGNENDDNGNMNDDNGNGNDNDNGNMNDDNGNENDHPGQGEVEFRGIVELMADDSWTISGQTVAIVPATEIKGVIAVGDLVKVHAFTADDGTLTAREIEPVVNEVRFTGQVEEMDDEAWTISGQVVAIVPQTEIRDEITAGDIVKVRALLDEDGTLTAVRIEKEDDDDDSHNILRFVGAVEAMNSDSWIVGGQTILINDLTDIRDAINLGDIIKVRAFLAEDGTLTALRLELADDEMGNDNDDANVNDNENGNMNDDDHGNMNEDDNGNMNDDDNGNMNDDDNGNMNDDDHGNSNDDNGDNGNANDNDDEDDDDNGGPGNGNDNDNENDDDDDDGNDNDGGGDEDNDNGGGDNNDNGDDDD